ncbi:MAG: phosphatase PAP2 family protein [Gemmatimonadetes bacterium]|nr:phosphatase PAP2 family protein [Gemmatimonadota bacterium]
MTEDRRRPTLWLVLGVAILVATHWLDRWGVASLAIPSANDRDWGRLLRVMGFAPTWLVVSAILWLEARGQSAESAAALRTTAVAIIAAVALGGLGAEALKLLVRRERPDPTIATYVFRPFAVDPWSTRRLGFPSSHAAVAFAGASALAFRFRKAAPILLGLAAGCGLTRVFAGAHFLSDVAGAGVFGSAAGWWVAGRFERRRARLSFSP